MLFEKRVINTFRKSIVRRQMTPEELFLFDTCDFDGLQKEDFEFVGNHGQRLVGAFYYYGEKSNTRLVIFEHGMGGGHRSYLREIEALCSRGFTVLSYDHTGCEESEGEDICGFSQSLADLDALIKTLKANRGDADLDISVIGHSWGGYSTLNIAKYHPDVTHIVAISGFISIRAIFKQFLGGFMGLYVKSLVKYEDSINPGYAYASADTSLSGSGVKAMVIHSDDDPTVRYDEHFAILKEALKDRPDTEFITIEGRRHNPNYTDSAVEYLGECIGEMVSDRRAGKLDSKEDKLAFRDRFDWWKMTEQDGELFDKIRDFLNS